jgi:hypothetical protein
MTLPMPNPAIDAIAPAAREAAARASSNRNGFPYLFFAYRSGSFLNFSISARVQK